MEPKACEHRCPRRLDKFASEVLFSPGSSPEFLEAAILECCDRGLEPLREIFETLKTPEARLSNTVKQKLIWDFVQAVMAA